jgi:hypothetical protein
VVGGGGGQVSLNILGSDLAKLYLTEALEVGSPGYLSGCSKQ